ncbi:hypothetical protein ACFWPU_01000 [Streptomyces sp. NPDC058471]
MNMVEYMKSVRTQSQARVDKVSTVHDSHNLTAAEQRAILMTLKGAKR